MSEQGRCGFCVGYKPGGAEPRRISTDVTQCPCCGQYTTELYEGACVSKHIGYGTQA